MATRHKDDDEERDTIARALAGVKPLAARPARAAKARRKPVAGVRERGEEHHSEPASEAPVFAIERADERIEGLAPGIDRAWLRRLRAGELAPERRIDLHGLSARDASRTVFRALAAAYEAGHRCVLIVHGRGTRSAEGAVLRAALPHWLASPPTAARVMAFASAQPADGGAGATYVLLRRRR